MEFPPWFRASIQRRLDQVSALIERHSELHKFRDEENLAFDAMFPGMDKTRWSAFMDWEDKHHFNRALENERLYLQGMRDGVQLVFSLLADPISCGDEAVVRSKTESNPVKPNDG
ncbi:hypothetical protein [Paenibacillus sp. GCM10027626]|uniref:hypothetical protein n=1 Tax=Paenibacillus sp. GCM10027626 TaxID=3273411 RepID=UPI00362D592D